MQISEAIRTFRTQQIVAEHIGPEERIFPVRYSTVRALIRCLAAKFHVKIRLMISGDIQPPMLVGMESRWRSFKKCY